MLIVHCFAISRVCTAAKALQVSHPKRHMVVVLICGSDVDGLLALHHLGEGPHQPNVTNRLTSLIIVLCLERSSINHHSLRQ